MSSHQVILDLLNRYHATAILKATPPSAPLEQKRVRKSKERTLHKTRQQTRCIIQAKALKLFFDLYEPLHRKQESDTARFLTGAIGSELHRIRASQSTQLDIDNIELQHTNRLTANQSSCSPSTVQLQPSLVTSSRSIVSL